MVEIASGNFGKVYRAIFESRLVVVKVPHADDLEAQLEEFNTLARIPPHPHLLPLIGGILAGNKQVWLVCPFMAGGSLERRMERQPAWGFSDYQRTRKAMVDMLDGLAHLHAHALCHRDRTFSMSFLLYGDVVHVLTPWWVI